MLEILLDMEKNIFESLDDSLDEDLYIKNENLNSAKNGDRVICELITRNKGQKQMKLGL